MIDDPPVTLQRHVPGRRRLVKLLNARQEFCTRKAFFDQGEKKVYEKGIPMQWVACGYDVCLRL